MSSLRDPVSRVRLFGYFVLALGLVDTAMQYCAQIALSFPFNPGIVAANTALIGVGILGLLVASALKHLRRPVSASGTGPQDASLPHQAVTSETVQQRESRGSAVFRTWTIPRAFPACGIALACVIGLFAAREYVVRGISQWGCSMGADALIFSDTCYVDRGYGHERDRQIEQAIADFTKAIAQSRRLQALSRAWCVILRKQGSA